MKKYCKNVSIHDEKIILKSLLVATDGKHTRKDVSKLLASGTEDELVQMFAKELRQRKLVSPPIVYKEKIDSSSGKVRNIGIQNIKHQVYDNIAAECIECMTPYVCYHQYARKGKSPEKGIRVISRWMRNRSIRYAVKLDIRKCYESITLENMMAFLERHIKNPDLLWLIRTLIESYGGRLSIGSKLSQNLCDLYLAQIYRHAMSIGKNRRGKFVRSVSKMAMYRDDMLLLATSESALKSAVKSIIAFCKSIGLDVKGGWHIKYLNEGDFVDLMGYRAYRDHVSIRRTTFRRIRRTYLRASRYMKIPVKLARRVVSYYGKFVNTDSFRICKILKVNRTKFRSIMAVVFYALQSNLRQRAEACQLLPA